MKTNIPLPEKFKNVSLSRGTMNPDDLIPVFCDFVIFYGNNGFNNFNAESVGMAQYIKRNWESKSFSEDTLSYYLNETLFNVIDTIAPDGCYFGAHIGNGSDYGFWEIEDYD